MRYLPFLYLLFFVYSCSTDKEDAVVEEELLFEFDYPQDCCQRGYTRARSNGEEIDNVDSQTYSACIFSPGAADAESKAVHVQTSSEIESITNLLIRDQQGNILFELGEHPPNQVERGWRGTITNGEIYEGPIQIDYEFVNQNDQKAIHSIYTNYDVIHLQL